MAGIKGTNQRVFLDFYDLTTYLTEVSVSDDPGLVDTTTLSSAGHTFSPTIHNGSLSISGIYDEADDASEEALRAAFANASAQPVTYCQDGYDAVGDICRVLKCREADLGGGAPVADVVRFTGTLQTEGGGPDSGVVLHPKSEETATGSEASVDNGTVGSAIDILTSSIANPSVITTDGAHGLTTGDSVTIAGHSGSTPDINGAHVVTVTSTTEFTIPVNVTVGGTGGTVIKNKKTDNGGVANLHVSAFTGTNIIVKVQHSVDDTVWVDLVTFATVTGKTSEQILVAAGVTVNRYLRDNHTVSSSTSTYLASFARR